MDNILLEFAAELREGFAELALDLAAWRMSPVPGPHHDALFRYLHTAKAGAGFVRMTRIEALATAAEHALVGVTQASSSLAVRQAALIAVALGRIASIAQAIELGIGYSTLGEDELITELLGQPRALSAEVLPFDPKQIRSVRLSLTLLDTLVEQAEALQRGLSMVEDTASTPVLAALKRDVRAHIGAVRGLHYAPARQLFDGLDVYVEQLAALAGKRAILDTKGADVWLDRAHIPILRHMLCHLLRNAVAHGIETPDERLARGKTESGLISLSVTHQLGSIAISVADDGRGVDYTTLADMAAGALALTDSLAQAGFTTLETPSAIAGRGVGLDAVRIALERIDGLLELHDQPGAGFRATLILPELTLTDLG